MKIEYNETIVITLSIILVVVLLLVAGIRPIRSRRSSFETNRLDRLGKIPAVELQRDLQYDTVLSLRHVVSTLLLVVLVPIAITAFGWLWGIVLSVVVALEYQKLASSKPVKALSVKFYGIIERPLLRFCERFDKIIRLVRASDVKTGSDSLIISSKDELLSLLKKGTAPLSELESTLLKSALTFEGKVISDIMTPRSVIESLDHDELLGPVLLNELHKTGHSRFPVTAGDIDHIVGVLYVRDLLVVDGSKNSKKVSQVMDEEVCFIHENQDLAHALKAFIKTEKLLFVVVNAYRETVGVVTLEDIVETLIGQKINDEFEHHTDLRAVAEQNIRKNNSPKSARDV